MSSRVKMADQIMSLCAERIRLKAANAELAEALGDLIYYLDDVSSPLLYGDAVDAARAALTKHQKEQA